MLFVPLVNKHLYNIFNDNSHPHKIQWFTRIYLKMIGDDPWGAIIGSGLH